MSVRQAAHLADILIGRELPWNLSWYGRAVVVPSSGPLPTLELPGGLRVTVLSPEEKDLERLSTRWDDETEKFDPSYQASDEEPPAEREEPDAEPAPETSRAPRPDVFVSYAHTDQDWAEQLARHMSAGGLDPFIDRAIDPGIKWSEEIESAMDKAVAALVLVSADYLASGYAVEVELPALRDRLERRELQLSWVVVRPAAWEKSQLVEIQAAHDPGRPLSDLDPGEREAAFVSIARTLADSVAAAPSRGMPLETSTDVPPLAAAPFRSDTSVANRSSMAFLIEFEGRSTLVGGDAHASTLERSVRRLLDERGVDRLRLDAFVVPHNGSRGNLSRELLAVVAADRYLISTDGSRFRHPDAETIARIIEYGRASPDARPTLVFNYRTETNDMWDDPALQERYGYDAVYPAADRGGIRADLVVRPGARTSPSDIAPREGPR